MTYQSIFKRYELKYLLTAAQREALSQAMAPYMEADRYGPTTIRNVYFDTPTFRLIRRSIERPAYKEKLRLRSYRQISPQEMAFVELKRKCRSVVYKRRLAAPQAQAIQRLTCGQPFEERSQIAREIEYFCGYYEALRPAVFLSYDREAFCARDGSDLRITFDRNILCRREGLSLDQPIGGVPLLGEGQVLMEIKTSGGIPLWLTHELARQRSFKTSFSKYGTAYEKIIFTKGGLRYA